MSRNALKKWLNPFTLKGCEVPLSRYPAVPEHAQCTGLPRFSQMIEFSASCIRNLKRRKGSGGLRDKSSKALVSTHDHNSVVRWVLFAVLRQAEVAKAMLAHWRVCGVSA